MAQRTHESWIRTTSCVAISRERSSRVIASAEVCAIRQPGTRSGDGPGSRRKPRPSAHPAHRTTGSPVARLEGGACPLLGRMRRGVRNRELDRGREGGGREGVGGSDLVGDVDAARAEVGAVELLPGLSLRRTRSSTTNLPFCDGECSTPPDSTVTHAKSPQPRCTPGSVRTMCIEWLESEAITRDDVHDVCVRT